MMNSNTDNSEKSYQMSLMGYALDHAIEDIFATKADGTMVYANGQFRLHHGLGCEDDISQINIKTLTPFPQTAEHWEHILSQVDKETGKGHFFLTDPIPDSPDVLAYEGHVYVETGTLDGEEVYWAFGHDVSERVRTELDVKRYNQVLDKVMENLPVGIVVKDVQNDFKFIYRNKESFNRDVPLMEAVGRTDFDFHPYEVAVEKRGQDEEVAKSGKDLHWVVEEKDGHGNTIYLDKRKMCIQGEDFSPLLLSIEWDVTEMEKMKRTLAAAKEKAETSDKLKSAFLANMSHEIRTPLNAIVGFSQLIAECTNADERLEYYHIVESSSEHLLGLVNEILDLSKIEAGMSKFDIKPISMDEVCRKVYDMLCLRCPEGVNLLYDESDKSVAVLGDLGRVTQVISNIVSNAFKFTTSGYVKYGYQVVNEAEVEVYIRDTGQGIPQEKLGNIFDRFVKADENVQGTGLGLSICKTIVERLGGQIHVTSEVGKGTSFVFTLPRTMECPARTSDLFV